MTEAKIYVDGHEMPVLTMDKLAEEHKPLFAGAVTTTISESGGLEGAALPYDSDYAVMYDVAGRIPNGPVLDFTLVRPPGNDPTLALPSLRPLRVVGREDAVADAEHQRSLYHAVGAVAVAGGHVEMALRRVYVSLTGGMNSDLDSAPTNWSELHRQLTKLCADADAVIGTKLSGLLAASEAEKLREKRNDIVHGYWWLIPMDPEHIVGARYPTGSQTPSTGFAKPAAVLNLAKRLFKLAAELEALVTPNWPIAIVPAIRFADSAVPMKLHSRADTDRSVPRPRQDSAPSSKRHTSRKRRKSKRR